MTQIDKTKSTVSATMAWPNRHRVVSKAALLARIKRRLAARDEMLVRSRSRRACLELGDYYVVDLLLNIPVVLHVDLEALGRELDALAAHEPVAVGAGVVTLRNTTDYDTAAFLSRVLANVDAVDDDAHRKREIIVDPRRLPHLRRVRDYPQRSR